MIKYDIYIDDIYEESFFGKDNAIMRVIELENEVPESTISLFEVVTYKEQLI